MLSDLPHKLVIPDDYNVNIDNNRINTNFPVSALGYSSGSIPGVNNISGNALIDDLPEMDAEEVFDPIFNIVTTREERQELDIIRAAAEESLPEATVEAIEFSLVKRELLTTYTILITTDAREGPGSINDPRLGVTKGNDRCGTCQRTVEHCPGHLGRIELAVPIINPFFKRDIITMLHIFCNTCGACLLTKNQIEHLEKIKHAKSRMKLIENEVVGKKGLQHTHRKDILKNCVDGIQTGKLLSCIPNPKYVLDKNGHKIEYLVDGNKHERTIEQIIEIFNSVSPEDAQLVGLGKNMPIDFIMFDIIVPPPKLRGASHKEVKNESDRMAEIFINIVQSNDKIKDGKLSASDNDTQKSYIYNSIKSLIESPEAKSYKGTSQVSMRMLIQGKEGIFRQFLMSKRADFTARSVIGPDPDADFGEASIPRSWIDKLTVRDKVFNANKSRLNALLQKGHITNVIKDSGKFKGMLRKINDKTKDSISLEIGDGVDRFLEDGDWVTLNRMPSLHKQSMMLMKVRLWDSDIIGLHLSYTTPFNADYDGDEMNIHSVQIIDAVAQGSSIMTAEMCIPNEQNNTPMMGLVFDPLLAVYLMTKNDDLVDEDTWNDCLLRITTKEDLATLDKRLYEQGVKKYTGKALFSALLPEGFYYEKGNVLIVDGILKDGVITGDHVKPGASGSIIQVIYNDPMIMTRKSSANEDTLPGLSRGLRRAGIFINDSYHVGYRWLSEYGASFGYSDCDVMNDSLKELMEEEFTKLKLAVNGHGGGTYETEKDRRQREMEIKVAIDSFKNATDKALMESIEGDNNFKILIDSKTKGGTINLSQMSVAVGQARYFGERLKKSITNSTRTFPHFELGEEELKAGGFIISPYIRGLDPQEYYGQAVSAREGLIISAMSISDIGMIRRNLFKMMEDSKTMVDGTVRDSNKMVIQSYYGDDGKSSAQLSRIMDNKKMPNPDFILGIQDHDSLSKKLNAKYGY